MAADAIALNLPRPHLVRPHRPRSIQPVGGGVLLRWTLIALALFCVGLLLVLPLASVLAQAFAAGWHTYLAALVDPDTLSAIRLTLLVGLSAVALNVVFGLAAAWCVARFRFPGRNLLVTLIDLPFSVSPVIAGMVQVLLFGLHGPLGQWLRAHDIQIIFALPGILLATVFVTLPFVACELIPLMEEQGAEEEEAAVSLGASGWQIFFRVTLPKIRWGLLYGVLLCNARAMGEFGAVSVVSGHIRGATNTMPLQVEILFNDYQIEAAFAVASLLALLALVAKLALEWRYADELAATHRVRGQVNGGRR
jgi:sulfate transport system permease protein